MDKSEYVEALTTFDWYYQYSDDGDVWRYWQRMHDDIMKAQPKVDPGAVIYNQYCPYGEDASA
jgi:hypothetical protein